VTADVRRLEFIGGPLDGAIRPVINGCETMPLAAGIVIHVYALDFVYEGPRVREVMRHFEVLDTRPETL
jgi:hypothetical protein